MRTYSNVAKYPNGKFAAVIIDVTDTTQTVLATTLQTNTYRAAARAGQSLKADMLLAR